jgi:hypothetical protein
MTASGGIIQLSARGKMSAVLHDDATHTLYRSQWTKYSPSALDDEILELSNSGLNTTSSTTLARYGDLVSRITLMIDLPGITAPSTVSEDTSSAFNATGAYYVNAVGLAAWDYCTLEIGGSTIETVYSDTAFVWEELAGRTGLRLEETIGRYSYATDVEDTMIEDSYSDRRLYVPIPFWFSRFPETMGLALPLVALMYHECRFKLSTRTWSDIAVVVYQESSGDEWKLSADTPLLASDGSTAVANSDVKFQLMVTYIYLDTAERASAASTAHTYLVTTNQRSTFSISDSESSAVSNKLYFSHVATALNFYYRPTNWNDSDGSGRRRYSVGFLDRYDFSAYQSSDDTSLTYGDVTDPMKYVSLTLNGHDRWPSKTYGNYFRLVTPYRSWKQTPSTYLYTYPFAHSPASFQPTSSLNMSRIDHMALEITYCDSIPAGELIVEALTMNLLLVKNGLGGLRWSS